MVDLSKIVTQVIRLAKEVGVFIREETASFDFHSIEEKSVNSLVTHVDKGSEKLLALGLQKILPQAGFLTEEKMVAQENRAYTWIIDPIDGTTNFIHQLPFYCISIALRKDAQMVLGVVYEINRREVFSAFAGGGAYLNNQPIQVRSSTHLKDAVIATGFPYYDYSKLDAYMHTLEYFMKHTRGVRRFGSAAMDMAYVACGRFDGFFEYGLNTWDVAAGIVLVNEAGGSVTDFTGGDEPLKRRELVASNAEISLRMTNVIRTAFNLD